MNRLLLCLATDMVCEYSIVDYSSFYNFGDRNSSDIHKHHTGACDTMLRIVIGFLSVTDTYKHTYIHTNYFRDAMQNLLP